MEKILSIINSEDFNLSLTNLLIDLYSKNYNYYFEEMWFDEEKMNDLNKDELERLTKLAAIIEYVGNRQPKAKLYDWIYSKKLILNYPYTPGVENESTSRVKRILFSPREFSNRNVFFDYTTIKPV